MSRPPARGPRRRLWRLVALLAGVLASAAGAADGPASEAEVKAVFLYNFANFVRWPEAGVRAAPAPYRYCVLDDDLAPVLDRALRGEQVEGRPLSLVREASPKSLAECHVLYVGRGRLERGQGWDLVRQGVTAQVLTVSDLEGFDRRGGMVALVREGRRIRPVINVDTVERAGLRVSAKLLGLATVTHGAESRN
jgi:hypothetical protein